MKTLNALIEALIKVSGIVWQKLRAIDYRYYFARWVQRLGDCYDATEPGMWMAVACGLVFGVMFTFMGFGFRNHPEPQTFLQGFWWCCRNGLLLALFLNTLIYVAWEINRFCKWLHRWAEGYTYGKRTRSY